MIVNLKFYTSLVKQKLDYKIYCKLVGSASKDSVSTRMRGARLLLLIGTSFMGHIWDMIGPLTKLSKNMAAKSRKLTATF